MAVNPLTYQELDAFCRRSRVRYTAWEADLIFRIDDQVLEVWTQDQPARRTRERSSPDGLIPAADTKRLKGLFRGLQAKKAAEIAAKAAKAPTRRAPTRKGGAHG